MIDFTQFTAFQQCPWHWYERYVAQLGAPQPEAQQDDPITIGSLVHAGIERLLRTGQPAIPDDVPNVKPSPEALLQAREMLHAYCQAFPADMQKWKVRVLEHPIGHDIIAKVDALVEVEDTVQLQDGLDGELTITAGLWVLEHKTTSERTPPAAFLRRWLMDMQADFQLIAVQDHFGRSANGVIINVVSRPAPRAATRTCRKCGAATACVAIDWARPACSACGAPQRWNPPAPSHPPTVWRFTVTRTPERLLQARAWIRKVADVMEEMRKSGRSAAIPNLRSCVDTWWRACPYLNLHLYGSDPNLVPINPYTYLNPESGHPQD